MDVKSAGRTLDIFEIFAREERALSLTELSKLLKAPLSSCFNLAKALEARGYIYEPGKRRQVYPTRKLFVACRRIAAAEPWDNLVAAELTALRDITGETIILGKFFDDRALYVDVVESSARIRFDALVGDVRPLHATAIGKALLLSMESAGRSTLVHRLKLDTHASKTITNPTTLLQQLEKSVSRGYVITRREYAPDAIAVGAPLRLRDAVYAVAIAGPAYRMQSRVSLCGSLLKETTLRIEAAVRMPNELPA